MCIKDLTPQNLITLKDITGVCPLIIALNRGLLKASSAEKAPASA
ncbi:MAG: hypothetical protein ACLFQK_08760 [Fibrobacterota bacterium]